MSEPRWIRFVECTAIERRTRRWSVQTRDGHAQLGTIEWYGPWRKYSFSPSMEAPLVFEEMCLRDVAAFVEARTREHREERKRGLREEAGDAA